MSYSYITTEMFNRAIHTKDYSIIEHPEVDKPIGAYPYTVLHALASRTVYQVIYHPNVDKVFNDLGLTPLDVLFRSISWRFKLTKEEISLARSFLDGKELNKLPLYINHPVLKEFVKYAFKKYKC